MVQKGPFILAKVFRNCTFCVLILKNQYRLGILYLTELPIVRKALGARPDHLIRSFFLSEGFMAILKKPLSFSDQLTRIKDHNIEVNDNAKALAALKEKGYYRLTGYALTYRKSQNDSDCKDGTLFSDILQLYQFDTELRHILRKYLEIAEVYYKTQIANGFALSKCTVPPYDQHYNDQNYYRKKDFNDIISSFRRQRNYYKDSLIVKHHDSKYGGKMPLWVVTELLSFSNTSKLYNSMFTGEKTIIANMIGTSPNYLSNHLHCLSVLRNKCSHGARLYDTVFMPSVRFNPTFSRKNPQVRNDTLFAYVLILVKRLPDRTTRTEFCNELDSLIQKYAAVIEMNRIGFPSDYKRILNNNL